MALDVKIPQTQQTFYKSSEIPLIQKKFDSIEKGYKPFIDNISKLTGVDRNVIKSFIFIESGGNPNAETPYAVGLMQVSTAGASDALVYEKSSGRLLPDEEAILKKTLGARMSNLDNLKPNQKSLGKTWVNRNDLLVPEFNILVGSIMLKQMVDEYAENGKARLDKVAVIYNTGKFSKVGKVAIAHKGTADELIAKIPAGQGNYIKKLLGVNSTLDILI
jgi:hypothetical protein